jgi:hypothetical protein
VKIDVDVYEVIRKVHCKGVVGEDAAQCRAIALAKVKSIQETHEYEQNATVPEQSFLAVTSGAD